MHYQLYMFSVAANGNFYDKTELIAGVISVIIILLGLGIVLAAVVLLGIARYNHLAVPFV